MLFWHSCAAAKSNKMLPHQLLEEPVLVVNHQRETLQKV